MPRAAEDHRRVRVVLLDDLGDLDRAVGMGQPVQIDAERDRIHVADRGLDVEAGTVEHEDGKVDDAHLETVALHVLGHGREAEGIHLEDRGRRNHVGDWSEHDRVLAEIVHARGVQQYDINPRHRPGTFLSSNRSLAAVLSCESSATPACRAHHTGRQYRVFAARRLVPCARGQA